MENALGLVGDRQRAPERYQQVEETALSRDEVR